MHKPIILVTLAYIAGLLVGHGLLYFPYSFGIFFILSIISAGILTSLGKLSLRLFFFTVIPGIVGTAAYLYSAAWFPSDHYTRVFTTDNRMHAITGVIVSPLDRDPDRTGFQLDLSIIDDKPVSGTVRVSVREESASIGYGDTVRIEGNLFKPRGFHNPCGFDYPAFLARSGIYYTVSVKNFRKVQVLEQGRGVFRTFQNWREQIRQYFLVSTTGSGSAILQAMVIGEEGLLTEDLRDRFMAAGVTHIISISGSHLGMVAVLCFGLLRSFMLLLPERFYHRLTLCVDPKKIAAWLTIPLVIFYTLLAGGEVATVRSLIMISAGLLALVLDRENALKYSLATAALVILSAGPQALFDISFQFSYLSVLVIAFVVAFWDELNIKAESVVGKLGSSMVLIIIISLATSLATGPLVAFYFNQFSLAGIFSNMVVIPFAGMVVVPLGLFSAIISLFMDHLPLAPVNQLVGDAFVNVVDFFARLPFAEFHPPSPDSAWLALYMLFLLSLAAITKNLLIARFKPFESSLRVPKGAVFGMTISGSLLLFFLAFYFVQSKGSEISFIDVGQGDCTLIRMSSGKTVLIDGGGTYDNRFDIGRRIVAPYLWNKGIYTLDLVILSHPHPDHMNGLRFILKKFGVTEVWESERDPGLPGYGEFRQAIAEKHIFRKTVSAENVPMMLGEAEVRVLHPSRKFIAQDRQAYASENNRSLVIRMAFDGHIALFPGDIGSVAEQHLARTAKDLRTDLLKVPHHGSKSSSSEVFASRTRPKVAVITVGKGNRYRHPSAEVVERYQVNGTQIYRTDLDGAVTVRVRNDRLDMTRSVDTVLERIELFDHSTWAVRERRNLNRLGTRITAKYP
jgi:competence protein ComEC